MAVFITASYKNLGHLHFCNPDNAGIIIGIRVSNKRSVKETFWMREVLITNFLYDLFAFIQNSPTEYKNFNYVSRIFYAGYALSKINSIRDPTKWLCVSSEELEIKIREHVEDFEDEMMNVSDYES